jgi:phospholipase C
MMENRSFDHWLGWLGSQESYVERGLARYGKWFTVNARNQATVLGPLGEEEHTQHMVGWDVLSNPYRGCDLSDPNHGWTSGRLQRDEGFLAPGANDDLLPIGYYEAADLPFTRPFVQRFTTFDDYHCSILGPTYPNRHYLHGAQSGGLKSNSFPTGPDGFDWPIIWDRLAAAGVSTRYYYSDLPFGALYGSRMTPLLRTLADFHTDCANGTLPRVCVIDPAFTGAAQNDDHPLADVRAGQAFLRSVFRSFAESPLWTRGLFVTTYDEWGGFWDHVPPVHLPDDRANAVDADDFSQAGFRVPTVLASPFAQPGLVDRRTYDHTSILRFLEWRFLGAPPEGPGRAGDSWFLTRRDRYASNIGASLAAEVVDAELGFDIDAIQIDPPSAACGTPAAGSAMERSILESNDPAFTAERWDPYLERMGLATVG